MKYFLITYNRRRGALATPMRVFDDQKVAMAERFRIEATRVDADLEVVVLGAEDEQDLVKTHSRYFKSVGDLARG